jgi:hypothetical protein
MKLPYGKYVLYMLKVCASAAISIFMHIGASAAQVTGDEAKIGGSPTFDANAGNTLLGGSDNYLSGNGVLYGVIGGGYHNKNNAPSFTTIAGGYYNSILKVGTLVTGPGVDGNYGTGDDVVSNIDSDQLSSWCMSVIGGGGQNSIIDSGGCVIAGGSANIIQPWVGFSVISGGAGNTIKYGSGYSVISGGTDNIIDSGAWWAAISGGQLNRISGNFPSTNKLWHSNIPSGSLEIGRPYYVGGTGSIKHPAGTGTIYSAGSTFTATTTGFSVNSGSPVIGNGEDVHHYGWIGGGVGNAIEGTGIIGSIGGGYYNYVEGHGGTISGGAINEAEGLYSTVPGGIANEASADYTFAAGRRAKADDQGAFVWADSTDADFSSTLANEFAVRATGGVRFQTSSSGMTISAEPGAGCFSTCSDRNIKENLKKVETRKVLQSVAAMPITTWNYKTQDTSIRHMGPMAQDFSAAFQIGEDNKHISIVDADGVQFASIQALNEIVEEKDTKIRSQDAKIHSLEERLQKIEALLSKHE